MNRNLLLWYTAFIVATLVAGFVGWTLLAGGDGKRASMRDDNAFPSEDREGNQGVVPVSVGGGGGADSRPEDTDSRIAALEETVARLERTLQSVIGEPQRMAKLESTVHGLKTAMEGISLEKASADRRALFAAEEGYLKADEYLEAGKFAIAGEGYLTFVENNPDHPDTREVMKKARDAFLRAGYKDKAFWVQDEMLKSFPDQSAADFEEMARVEKNAGYYDRAVDHIAQAADLAPTAEERLWKRLYWAWYVQLRDGTPAGISALKQVQQEIATSGVGNPKLSESAAERMQEWQGQLNAP